MTTPDTQASEEPQPGAGTADALIMFGLTGDLGEKKLFPALVELIKNGVLQGPVIGVGRSQHSDDELWKMLEDAVGAEEVDSVRDRLKLSYLSGDSQDAETYNQIAERLNSAERPVVYAAIPPDLFGGVAKGIGQSTFPDTTRLVVEKPFGSDSSSAQELFDSITEWIPEENLFAVDHFLAKATVENLMTFRRANPMVEASFRAGPVRRIELTMAEAFGVDGRGGFYDGVGALRDVVQNHLLQTLAVLMMEPPADETAAAFDAARADLLASIQPVQPSDAVFGQFEGYLQVEDVADDSKTETYVAARLRFTSSRWEGVDVVIRTGKSLADTYTEAVVIYDQQIERAEESAAPNRLRFSLKPESTIALEVAVLNTDDVDAHELSPRLLWACTPSEHGELSDYASMLAGALTGDQRHFAQIQDILASWRVLEPLLELDGAPVSYAAGSMGPEDADRLLGHAWVDGPLPDLK